MTRYALALFPDEPRCLVEGIGSNVIKFDINGWKIFDSLEEIEEFKRTHKNHFFDLNKLTIIEVPKGKT